MEEELTEVQIEEKIADIAANIDNEGFHYWLDNYATVENMPTLELKGKLNVILLAMAEIEPTIDDFRSHFEV